LILLGHGENSIFEILLELSEDFPELRLIPVIADVRDRLRIASVFATHQPEVVFHAAAHKHVPLMEANPAEAVTNNVMGTGNLLEIAAQIGVERFVLISTDKAVQPSSVYGATKRLAEMLVLDSTPRESSVWWCVLEMCLGAANDHSLFKTQTTRRPHQHTLTCAVFYDHSGVRSIWSGRLLDGEGRRSWS
jgi:FlaA1/EpsC-like NDP-sugar epimerase